MNDKRQLEARPGDKISESRGEKMGQENNEGAIALRLSEIERIERIERTERIKTPLFVTCSGTREVTWARFEPQSPIDSFHTKQ